jgi:predicted DNA-binding ArsR family transcriptional regulator
MRVIHLKEYLSRLPDTAEVFFKSHEDIEEKAGKVLSVVHNDKTVIGQGRNATTVVIEYE